MKRSSIILTLLFLILCLSSCKNQEKAVKQPNDNDIKVAQLVIDAATQRELGNFERASSLYKEVIKFQPNNSLAYYQLAAIDFENKNIADAIENNLKAIEFCTGSEKLKKNFCIFDAYSTGMESIQIRFPPICFAASNKSEKKSVFSLIIENSKVIF